MSMPNRDVPRPPIKRRQNQDGEVWFAEWVTYSPQLDGTHKKIHRSAVGGRCDEISERKARKKIYAQIDTEWKQPTALTDITVGQYIRDVWLKIRETKWARHTKADMHCQLTNHILPRFGEAPIGEVRKFHIEAFLAEKSGQFGRTTINRLYWILHSVFGDALDNDLIGKNPARKVELPKMAEPPRSAPYTPEQVRELCEIPGVEGVMLRLMLFCGLRPGELITLKRDDVDGNILRVDESTDGGHRFGPTKTKRTRYVVIPSGLLADLCDHMQTRAEAPGTPLFVSGWGKIWTRQGLDCHLAAGVKKLIGGKTVTVKHGLVHQLTSIKDFTMRRCRTTFATYLEGDVADTQALLGHSTPKMTMRYYKQAIPARQVIAVEALERRLTGRGGQVVEIRKAEA